VEFTRDGVTHTILARREVVLCGGVFNTPQLLQISGVGPGSLLAEHGIPVVVHLPGVGENLQDHLGTGMTYHCSKPITVNAIVNNPVRRTLGGLRYIFFRSGFLASHASSAAGMVRTDPSLPAPDVKLQFRNWNRSHSGRAKQPMGLHPLSSFSVTMALMHPDNRGSVRIRSANANEAPVIRFNFFQSEKDQRTAVAALKVIRRIMSMPAMKPYVLAELTPGVECTSDADLLAHCRKRALSSHHPVGTCAMGNGDMAVVDSHLRVRGVGRLRVMDASVFPRQVAAHTVATVVMVAEKGCDMLVADSKSTAIAA